jgi:hypothetical protein
MSFRQKNKFEFKKFSQENKDELLEIGLPLITIENEDNWIYFMEHGECFFTKWSVRALNKEKANQLLEVVKKYPGNFGDMLKEQLYSKIISSTE